jgi:hypothetical protein
VLRKRSTLEDLGLIPRIPVDIHPLPGAHMPPMFDGLGLRTSSAFDAAYQAAEKFTRALRKQKKSAGFMRSLMLQRLAAEWLLYELRMDGGKHGLKGTPGKRCPRRQRVKNILLSEGDE